MKDNLLTRILNSTPVDVEKTEVFIALSTKFEEFKAEANGVVEAYATQVADLQAQLAASVAKNVEFEEKLQSEAEKVVAMKLAARKEKIVAAIGETTADGVLEATKNMEDAQFETVVAALAGRNATEAKSALFTEIGVDAATATPQANGGVSEEMKLLRQKYPVS